MESMTETDSHLDRGRPTSKEVVQALRDAGWLLEQDTAAAVEAAGFHAVTGKAFPDPDDPTTSREIDVHGYRQLFRSDEMTFSVGARILAECKQSSMPYVLVGGPAKPYELGRDRLEQHYRFPRVEVEREELGGGKARLHSVRGREYLGLDRIPGNPWEPGFLASQMTRLDRKKKWVADNRGIFDSLVYPLAKALTHFRSQSNRSSYVHHRVGQEWASIDFYYPIIVTSAVLFTVDATASEIDAVEVPWASMTREIKSSKIDGQFNIDVVTHGALPGFLNERVNRFCNDVAKLATSDPQRFVNNQDYGFKREAQ
jgi:hypothetical protein